MLKIAKGFTALGGFATLLIGLVFLGVTIWAFVNSALAFDRKSFLVFVLLADLAIIFGSALGIYGIKKQIGILIFIFQILIVLFFFVFLSIGIAAEVAPRKLFKQDCGSPNSDEIIQAAYTSYAQAKLGLCISCPCKLSNHSINSFYSVPERKYLNALPNKDEKNGAMNYQSCAISDKNQTYRDLYQVLAAVEYSFSCSGWCDNDATNMTNLFYKFSDINRGRPQSTCFDTMKQKLIQYGGVLALFAFCSAALMFVMAACSLYICCSRKQKDFKAMFLVNDGGNYVKADY